MAESARQLEPQEEGDEEPERLRLVSSGERSGPSHVGQLSAVPDPVYDEGGAEPSDPIRHLRDVEDGAGAESDSQDSADEDDETPTRDDLYQTERQAPDGGHVNHVYRPSSAAELTKMKPSFRGVFGFAKTNRGKVIIGGVGASLITLLIIGFSSLLPFKILHIMNNLQSHFFASSENALTRETDVMFSDYVKKYVLPGLNTCRAGRTIDKSCTPKAIQGNSIVSKLYKGWSNARIENTFAEKYGIEFAKVGRNYYIKTSGMSGNGVELDKAFLNSSESFDDFFQRSGDAQIRKIGRNELRQTVYGALDTETGFKKYWYRFRVGALLKEKYGVNRCIVACQARDNFADWKDNKKLAAKAYLIDRVITPRSAALGIVLKCLLAGTGDSGACSISPQSPATECSGDCELSGEPETGWESNLRSQLLDYEQTLGTKSAQSLIDEVKAIRDKGYSAYIFEKVLTGLTTSDGQALAGRIKQDTAEAKNAAQAAQFAEKFAELSKSANIVGAINTAANIFDNLSKAGPLLSKLTYVTNSQTMVAAFTMYRTYADEIKTGNVDASIVGSFTDSLSSGIQDPNDSSPQLGGTAGAEQTPLYNNLFDQPNSSSATVSFLDSLLPAKALAVSNPYTCADGKPVPSGKLICNEDNLNYNPIAADFTSAFNNEPLSTIKSIVGKYESIKKSFFGKLLGVVNWTVGKLTSFITSIANLIPGVSNLEDLAAQLLGKLSSFLISQTIPSPVASNMGGGQNFVLAAGGADVTGNYVAHYGLGGQELTSQQQAAIVNDQQQLAQAQSAHESFLARMFDTNSDTSFITKLAMAMPSSATELKSSVANLFINPFKSIFSSILTPGRAQAATDNLCPGPFGVTCYGYLPNDPVFSQDPDKYWQQNCVDPGQDGNSQVSLATDKETYKWDASATLNPTNYMPENSTTNPCLLIQSAVISAGSPYDSSLLTPDDLDGSDTSTSEPQPTSSAGSTIDMTQLYNDSTSVACAAGTRSIGIYDGYTNGQPVKIRLCAIPNLPSGGEESKGGFGVSGANGQAIVNSRVSGAVLALVTAADKAGIGLSANSSFRTMSHQLSLCPCDGVTVAKPGYSNHQMGLAIDFSGLPFSPGPLPGNKIWDWLSQNAATYGYKNYPKEAWHWSPTGN